MNPELMQWASQPGSQKYLQQVGLTPEMLNMGQPGQMGQPSGYNEEIMRWINANPNNPSLQNNLLGMYFDATNPANQQQMDAQKRADDINLALAFMELGETDLANEILMGYGIGGGSNDLSGQGYYGNVRNTAAQTLKDTEGRADRGEWLWNEHLSGASNEQIDAYDKTPSVFQRTSALPWWANALGGATGTQPILAALFGGEEARRRASGYRD